MKAIMALIFVCLAGTVFAQITTYDIIYDIQPDFTVKETIHIVFENQIGNNMSYVIDKPVKDVEISDGENNINYKLSTTDNKYIINILPETAIKELYISFFIHDYVFSSGDDYVFFSMSDIATNTKELTVSLLLPEGYGIIPGGYSPKTGTIKSDGRRIGMDWTINNNSFSTTVKFEQLNKEFNFLVPLSLIILLIFLYTYFRLRKKARESFYKGFSEDETKVIKYMEENPVAYQNKIEQEFKFSRAKMTRIVKKLEEKGLLEKRKKGRTNRLTWRK